MLNFDMGIGNAFIFEIHLTYILIELGMLLNFEIQLILAFIIFQY